MMRATRKFLSVLALGFFVACGSDLTGPNGVQDDVGRLNLAVRVAVGASASLAPAFDLVLSDGGNTLEIDRVALVLREIELEGDDDGGACEDAASDSSSDDDSDDDCEFEVGPFLLELPLDGTTETQIQLDDVRPGRYDELEFDIHKPDDDTAGDLDFIAVHPDFRDVSIRVEGTYNGQSFLYLTDLNEEQEIDLVPPIVVGGGETVQVTLALDVGGWFRRGDGSLVDPATANKGGPNEDLVEDNIESSIELEDDEDDD